MSSKAGEFQCDEGAWTDLVNHHRELDRAVLVAYGWTDLDPAQEVEINQRLFELNRDISGGRTEYDGPPARA